MDFGGRADQNGLRLTRPIVDYPLDSQDTLQVNALKVIRKIWIWICLECYGTLW